MKKISMFICLTALALTLYGNNRVLADKGTIPEEKLEQVVLLAGETRTLISVTADEKVNSRGSIWVSTNALVASVDEEGVVTGVSAGEAQILNMSPDGKETLAKFACSVHEGIKSLKFKEESLILYRFTGDDSEAHKLELIAEPKDNYNQGILFQSSDPDIASVDAEGNIKAISLGTADIIASASTKLNKVEAKCKVTVKQAVTDITGNVKDIVLYLGESANLDISIKPENATDKTVAWMSNNPELVAVDYKGKITAKKVGKTMISCTAADSCGASESFNVEVRAKVNKISLEETDIKLLLGALEDHSEKQLTCIITPSDAEITTVKWTSSNEKIVSVDENGLIKAVSQGKAVVSATSDDPACSMVAKCNVTVEQAVMFVSVSDEEVLYVGEKIALKAAVSPQTASNHKLIWSSQDSTVAQVDANGSVVGKAVGSTVIYCEAQDGSGAKAQCTIEIREKVKEIRPLEKEIVLFIGLDEEKTVKKLKVAIIPETAFEKELIWESSDEGIVTVDSMGQISAVAEGKTTITAVSKDEHCKTKAAWSVTVKKAVQKIEIIDIPEKLEKGKTYQLQAVVSPENATEKKVIWSSSDENVLRIDQNGKMRAVGGGKAVIICKAADGSEQSAECTLEVVQLITKLEIKGKEFFLPNGGHSLALELVISPRDASNKTVEWTSSVEGKATVNDSGVVTSSRRGVGKAVITAKTKDGSNIETSVVVTIEREFELSQAQVGQWNKADDVPWFSLEYKNVSQGRTIDKIKFSYYGVDEKGDLIQNKNGKTECETELSFILKPGQAKFTPKVNATELRGAKIVYVSVVSIHYTDGLVAFPYEDYPTVRLIYTEK